jgi:uncharacterized damage-inducible protein DinB
MSPLPEVWLRGPLPDVPPLLQPIVHSLLQVVEDAERVLVPLGADAIWTRPGRAASVGFHARHLVGSLDRLLTYARGERLSPAQMDWLRAEADPGDPPADAATLLAEIRTAVGKAVEQVRTTPEASLTEVRHVGRAQLPTTTFGLLVHAAEHSTRHAGQMITTALVLSER